MKHEQKFLLLLFTSTELTISQCLKEKLDISYNYKRLKQENYLAAQKN